MKQWLEQQSPVNFPAGRVRVFAHGQTNPVAPNATPEGRAQNRRVEIVLGDDRERERLERRPLQEAASGIPAEPAPCLPHARAALIASQRRWLSFCWSAESPFAVLPRPTRSQGAGPLWMNQGLGRSCGPASANLEALGFTVVFSLGSPI